MREEIKVGMAKVFMMEIKKVFKELNIIGKCRRRLRVLTIVDDFLLAKKNAKIVQRKINNTVNIAGNIQELNLIRNRFAMLEMSERCPIESLETGDEYFIFGDSQNGNIYIYTHRCYGNTMVEETTLFDEVALEKYYEDNCECYNRTGEYTNMKNCEWNFSFMKKHGENCNWANTTIFQFCQNLFLGGYGWYEMLDFSDEVFPFLP